jgi:dTDP-4-dehydrorhamnose reductase
MKILVTGSNGQLGQSIRQRADQYPNLDFVFTDIGELDITDYAELKESFAVHRFQAIINCAAYTAVDKAETEAEKAYTINAIAVKYLSKLAGKYNAIMIHISTDYIFNGKNYRPYVETDKPNPGSIYAKTKLEAEKQVMKHAGKALILRTSWLYSEYGHNFVKTIIRLAGERKILNVVADQTGTPTYAGDVADALLWLIGNNMIPEGRNIYHFSNEGSCSWFDFAYEILDYLKIPCRIIPIKTEDYPLPAQRPFYSVLCSEKFRKTFDYEIPYWRKSLHVCLKKMV